MWINTLENCTCTIESDENSALIDFCDSHLELDKDGKLYIISPMNEPIELKKK